MASISRPSGHQYSSDFAMKRRYRRGKSGAASGQGSKFELWLAAITKPPVRGRFSTPSARSRYTVRRKGTLTLPTNT